jgi:hypothetical protein
LPSQRFKTAELKLFDGALGAPEMARNFANALLLRKTHLNDAALIYWKATDETKNAGAVFNVFQIRRGWSGIFPRGVPMLPGGAFPTIREGVGRDAIEPRGKRNAAPLESPEMGERLMEYLGGQVLRLVAVSHASRDECIHPLEVVFIELGEAAGISLRRFNEKPLGGFALESLQQVLRILRPL